MKTILILGISAITLAYHLKNKAKLNNLVVPMLNIKEQVLKIVFLNFYQLRNVYEKSSEINDCRLLLDRIGNSGKVNLIICLLTTYCNT